MDFVRAITNLFACFEFLDDLRITSRRHECREPIQSGEDAILHLPGRDVSRPSHDGGRTETTFQPRSLAACKRSLPAIWPTKVLRAVVGGKYEDGVVIDAVVFQVFHDRADYVIELRHSTFLDAPAILGCTHVFVFVGQMSKNMHARWVEPQEEWLILLSSFVREREGSG